MFSLFRTGVFFRGRMFISYIEELLTHTNLQAIFQVGYFNVNHESQTGLEGTFKGQSV